MADALAIPKASLYRHLKAFSLYQWKSLLVRIGCTLALAEIRDVESKSAATRSRRCITISVDDTNDPRYGKLLSYCYKWWSKKHNNAIRGIKVLSYLFIQDVSRSVRKTFHQIQLELSGQRHLLSTLSEHFQEQIPNKH